jgi:hypothetical protein
MGIWQVFGSNPPAVWRGANLVILAQRNSNQLKDFLKDLGPASLGFIEGAIREGVEFGEQLFYAKTKCGFHRQRR